MDKGVREREERKGEREVDSCVCLGAGKEKEKEDMRIKSGGKPREPKFYNGLGNNRGTKQDY